jgi:hypothetical protein
LIAFYYGRNPKTMQADTVLQHSRTYGNRDRRDLAVTHFYTSKPVYDRLYTINKFENALRRAFEHGKHEQGVVFIQADPGRRVRPCAPNKVLVSNVVAIDPTTPHLPRGFQTKSGTAMNVAQRELDKLIPLDVRDQLQFFELGGETARKILTLIRCTLDCSDAEFDWDTMIGLLDYYSDVRDGGEGKVPLPAETGRHVTRAASGDKTGRSIILNPAV